MDISAFSDLQRSVLVIIVGVVIAAHCILKTFNIMRIHQNEALTSKEYLNILGSICGCISDWLFLWIFLVCLYLFIFFKTQLDAYVLMPLPSSSLQKNLVEVINVAGGLKVCPRAMRREMRSFSTFPAGVSSRVHHLPQHQHGHIFHRLGKAVNSRQKRRRRT
jgi:hypothetical protein